MRREVAVGEAEAMQVIAQQREVQRLLAGDAGPVAVVGVGQSVEAPDRIERQVDRVQLDVRDRMDQRRAAFGGADAALADLRMRHDQRPRRPAGDAGRLGDRTRRIGGLVEVERERAGGLAIGVGFEQQGEREVAQRAIHRRRF
jgi:hypothetical protein